MKSKAIERCGAKARSPFTPEILERLDQRKKEIEMGLGHEIKDVSELRVSAASKRASKRR